MKRFLYKVLTISIFVAVSSALSHAQKAEGVENLLLTAVERITENDYKTAEIMLDEVVKADASNDAGWYYLSQVAFHKKDAVQAEACLRKAVELDPSNFWYRYRLARLYMVTSRPELTIDLYEKLLEDFPEKTELYLDLAEMYASQEEYDKALEILDEIDKVSGVTESVAVYRFNILRVMGRMEEAFASLKEYNNRYSSPFVLSALADYEMSMYNDSTALAYYDEALDIAPDYAPALLGKAEALRVTRRYDEYFPIVYRYVGQDGPAQSKTDYLMALVQRADPKFVRTFQPQMDTLVLKTVEAHPTDSLVYQTAGIYYYSTGRNAQAKDFFAGNVELHPDSFSANADYVEFLMYAEYWKELSEAGREAFDRFPQETSFLEMASVGDYNLEDYGKVLEICGKVLEVAPADSSRSLRALSTMGDVYHRLGENKKAYKAYKKALKINPDYVYVLNNYAYYLSEEGKKLKKALAMSHKTVQAEPDNATYLDTYAWILYLLGRPEDAKLHFKHAMLYGGKDSPVILDHYAEVLYALKEYDLAIVYWNMAMQKNNGDIPDLEERIKARKAAIDR